MSEFVIDGKPLSSLRVVDLKEELEKRGLSKSGTKKDLYERLKTFLTAEKEKERAAAAAAADEEQLPNISIQQKLADQNPFLRDYFASQAELFHEQKRVQKVYLEEKKRESEASADEGGSSPSKSGGGSPLKSPSQSPVKRGSEQPPLQTMVLANESPVKVQQSPKKSVDEIVTLSEPVQLNISPEKPVENATVKPIQQEKSASPVKNIPVPQPAPVEEPALQDRSPRKSARNREHEPPAMAVEPTKGNLSPVKIAESAKGNVSTTKFAEPVKGSASPTKMSGADNSPQKHDAEGVPGSSEIEESQEPKEAIKEPSPRRRSSREVVTKPDDTIRADLQDQLENRIRTRRGSQQTRTGALQNNVNKTSEAPKKLEENNISDKVILEEKIEEKKKEEQPPETRRTRGGRQIIFDVKKDEPKEPHKVEEETKKESDDIGPESKRIPLRTRAERFKKELAPPASSVAEPKEQIDHKPVPIEQPRKMSSSSDETAPAPSQTAAPSKPRRGGREIVFDIKLEAKPAPAPPPAKRAIALLSTEELASDEVLDFGDDDKDKKEEGPVEREPWLPRKINVKNKAPCPENMDRTWTKNEPKEEEDKDNDNIPASNLTWQYLKETYYPDLALMPDDDLKLDAHDSSFDDKNFGRQFDDFQITRTISNEFAAENGNKIESLMEINTEPVPVAPRKRMISEIIEDEEKEVSPSRNPPSEVLKITNLVRPFTQTQLKELLQRTGNIVDLWLDKIKSKCVVQYEEEAQALETRAAIHGIAWPSSNTKYLRVDYSTPEELEELRNKELNDERPKIEENKDSSSTSAAIRAWDLGKDGRARRRSRSLSKEKELDRKRPRRSSRSPDERGIRRDRDHRTEHAVDRDKKETAKTGKALDELFRKTVATPCIYWLPLTPQQIAEKEELRRQRMLERDRKISEMQQRDQHPREHPPRYR